MSSYSEIHQRVGILDNARESEAREAEALLNAIVTAIARELGANREVVRVEYSDIESPKRFAHRWAEQSTHQTTITITIAGDDADTATFAFECRLAGSMDPSAPAEGFRVGFDRSSTSISANARDTEAVQTIARGLVHACLAAVGVRDGQEPIATPRIS